MSSLSLSHANYVKAEHSVWPPQFAVQSTMRITLLMILHLFLLLLLLLLVSPFTPRDKWRKLYRFGKAQTKRKRRKSERKLNVPGE